MTKEQLEISLETDYTNGLSDSEARERLKEGVNELTEAKRKSLLLRFLGEFKDVLIIILILAAVISAIVNPHDLADSIIIFAVVIINAILGVYQENRAEKSLDALKKLSSPIAKVLRDGHLVQIESKYLVRGDVIFVEAGDFVPADARLLEVSNLKADESSLTGESLPAEKTAKEIGEIRSLGDRINELFASTSITYGRGKAVVTQTGMKTEIGKIAALLSNEKEELTPLQEKLNQIGKIIAILAIVICAVVFFTEWLVIYRNEPQGVVKAFSSAVALAVAAIPEGLSTVVVVVLSLGVTKMVRHHAIVKKLPAVETLGSTSIVCSDKTGTLTQNKMTVVKLYRNQLKDITSTLNDSEAEMLTYFALCTDARISKKDGREVRVGDPTETALVSANMEKGKEQDPEAFRRIAELPFDSVRKMMTVVIDYHGRLLSITKGAVDVILNHSLPDTDKEKIRKVNLEMASKALRVLGVAVRFLDLLPKEISTDVLESELEFIGLVGMIDPARPEVKEAIDVAKGAGIRTIMITGDHVITAKAIAKELGILQPNQEAITSEDLNGLSTAELYDNIEKYSVYARVAPEDKVRIVEAWQKKGMVVAMTGDGVNDSPALKKADIGCAMGITGTDVAKEAASMILTDDNFSTIITAVKQGRGIYDNIRKTVHYLLSSNIGEVLTMFLATILSAFAIIPLFGLPLGPKHLLWINLITDTLPAFALGVEKPEDDVMKRKPRPKNENFFAHGLGYKVVMQGIIIGLITLLSYTIGITSSKDTHVAQTMAFLTLAMIQLFHALNIKSNHSVFSRQIWNNRYLWFAFFTGLLLQIAVLYISAIAKVFDVTPLSSVDILISLSLAFTIIPIMETVKFYQRRIERMKEEKESEA